MDFEPTHNHAPSPYDPVAEVLKKMEAEKVVEGNVLEVLDQHLRNSKFPE